jgi:MFS family permease
LIGAAAFGIASVLAAFSTSANMLIATRALLGVAGATLAPSTLSLIRNMFLDPAQRTVAIGVWISSYSAGAVIGPVVGGVLLQFFPWGSVFLIGVPVMVLLLVLGPILLPEYRDPGARRGSTWPAWRCRWRRCWPSSTASSRSPSTGPTWCRRCRSRWASRSAGCSRGGRSGSRIR